MLDSAVCDSVPTGSFGKLEIISGIFFTQLCCFSAVVTQHWRVPHAGCTSELFMTRRNYKAETEREIQRQWYLRPEDQRTASDVERFAEDMWRDGLRLDQQANTHFQNAHALLRKY
ncbi:hypothetical protein SDC9_99603 [bioreactor metagenome]|uniref:Uncharacterized protein n=1 Tax=bioreactor metagenome TaxID=1076179 RepID=A0A645AI24_9ZZZZ